MTTNTTPELGQPFLDIDKADKEDQVFWSVTTIIGALDKPALLYWAAEQTANAAIDDEDVWKAMLNKRGHKEAVKWLRDARFRPPLTKLSAADLGTVTHDCCEHYALSGEKPGRDYIAAAVRAKGGDHVDIDSETQLVATMADRFDGWLQRFTPSYQATEVTVYSKEYGYAGTADAFATVDGVRFICDYKTSREPFDNYGKPKTPYPEQVGLQLAAYRYAEFAAVWRPRRFEQWRRRYYALGQDEQAMAIPVPEVDQGLVIHITPESCEAYPIRCDREVHTAFLYVQESFRWLSETSRRIMGDPLVKATQ